MHYSLGVFSGVVLAAIFSRLRYGATVSMDLLVGAIFGFVIYIVNFHVLTRVFPWFAESRGMATLLAHLVFGDVGSVSLLAPRAAWTRRSLRLSRARGAVKPVGHNRRRSRLRAATRRQSIGVQYRGPARRSSMRPPSSNLPPLLHT